MDLGISSLARSRTRPPQPCRGQESQQNSNQDSSSSSKLHIFFAHPTTIAPGCLLWRCDCVFDHDVSELRVLAGAGLSGWAASGCMLVAVKELNLKLL